MSKVCIENILKFYLFRVQIKLCSCFRIELFIQFSSEKKVAAFINWMYLRVKFVCISMLVCGEYVQVEFVITRTTEQKHGFCLLNLWKNNWIQKDFIMYGTLNTRVLLKCKMFITNNLHHW